MDINEFKTITEKIHSLSPEQLFTYIKIHKNELIRNEQFGVLLCSLNTDLKYIRNHLDAYIDIADFVSNNKNRMDRYTIMCNNILNAQINKLCN